MLKPLILVSNDDGINSPGLLVLSRSLRKLGDVYVVAPDRERSAASHSLTLHKPLRVDKVANKMFSVDGTPTDCVNLAINSILPRRPDLVVAGINKGENLGDDVTYSGTVSAAMEGTLLNIPSMAVSMISKPGRTFKFEMAAAASVKIARHTLKYALPADTLLNINVPLVRKVKGVQVTRLGKRIYGDAVVEKIDPRGKKYYWIGGNDLRWEGGEDTDFHAISRGYISITPIHLDLTNYNSLKELDNLVTSLDL
ncbi:MAG: 5'/3'-nucleotidase SurE [Nitrospinota bacterium]